MSDVSFLLSLRFSLQPQKPLKLLRFCQPLPQALKKPRIIFHHSYFARCPSLSLSPPPPSLHVLKITRPFRPPPFPSISYVKIVIDQPWAARFVLKETPFLTPSSGKNRFALVLANWLEECPCRLLRRPISIPPRSQIRIFPPSTVIVFLFPIQASIARDGLLSHGFFIYCACSWRNQARLQIPPLELFRLLSKE